MKTNTQRITPNNEVAFCKESATHDSMKLEHTATEFRPADFPRASELTDMAQFAPMSDWNGAHMDDDTALDRSLKIIFENSAESRLEIQLKKYEAYLDDPTLSDAEKERFIGALWDIINAFVDLGFGIHPAQQVFEQEVCGKLADRLDPKAGTDSNETDPLESELCDHAPIEPQQL